MDVSLSPRALGATVTLAVTAICAYLWLVLHVAATGTYAAWAALVLIPFLLALNVPLLVRAGRRDPDPRFLRLLCWAFALKCLASVARWLMAFVLYGGSDAGVYSNVGEKLAIQYRNGNFGADTGRGLTGTGFMRALTGGIYAITGPSLFLAFALFTIMAFWGTYYLYRAFKISVPDGDHRRYAMLILFLPSMLFWSSSLGKEALMVLGIGLLAYGSAQIITGYHRWLVPLCLGVAITALVRPHITAALVAGLAVAMLVGRRGRPANATTPLAYLLTAALVLVGGAAAAKMAASFFGVDELSPASVQSIVAETADRTDTGGSSYDAVSVDSLTDLPLATFTVLFRPLVFEASNAQMLAAALECTALLVLIALSWRSLVQLPGRLRKQPYLILSLVYLLIFIYAFSNFGNFGILTRQRVQVLPFLLVFLALRTPRPPEEPLTMSDRDQERALT